MPYWIAVENLNPESCAKQPRARRRRCAVALRFSGRASAGAMQKRPNPARSQHRRREGSPIPGRSSSLEHVRVLDTETLERQSRCRGAHSPARCLADLHSSPFPRPLRSPRGYRRYHISKEWHCSWPPSATVQRDPSVRDWQGAVGGDLRAIEMWRFASQVNCAATCRACRGRPAMVHRDPLGAKIAGDPTLRAARLGRCRRPRVSPQPGTQWGRHGERRATFDHLAGKFAAILDHDKLRGDRLQPRCIRRFFAGQGADAGLVSSNAWRSTALSMLQPEPPTP